MRASLAGAEFQDVSGRLRTAVEQLLHGRTGERHAEVRGRLEDALFAAEQRLWSVVANMPIVLAVIDREGLFAECAGAGLRGLDLMPGDVVGRSVFEAYADAPELLEEVRRAIGGEERSATLELRGRVLETRTSPFRDRNGERQGAISVWLDVSERVRAEAEAKSAGDELDALRRRALAGAHSRGAKHDACLFESTVAQASDAIVLTSADLAPDGPAIVLVNQAFTRMTGYASKEVIGKPLDILHGPRSDGALDRAREALAKGETFCGEIVVYRKDGQEIAAEWEMTPIREGTRVTNFLLVQHDISERKRAQTAMEHQALHDGLTDLPNRMLLHDRLEQAILIARRQLSPLCLLLMDLDNFKDVNDTFGHQAGDGLLRQVAQRLRENLREADTVARLGGDEFAMVLPATDLEGAVGVARKILGAFDRPFTVLGQELDTQASIGVAAYSDDVRHGDELLRRADVAMYVAKRSRGGYAAYAAEDDEHSPERLLLVGELRRALERGELVLHYQPEVSFASGRIVGMEALVRWNHPRRGLLPPAVFVPLAERTGLIKPLYEWVLSDALRQVKAWQGLWDTPVVAVNAAMPNVMDPRFPQTVSRALAAGGVAPDSLRVEITESVIMADPERARNAVAELRGMGVQVSIDDFGTGYSSLGYLQRLDVNEIKIDKSFVIGVAEDRNRAAIVRATVDLGHHFGLSVVAEGVEDQRSWDVLFTSACDTAQGFHISPPLPPADAVSSLVQRGWLRRDPTPATRLVS